MRDLSTFCNQGCLWLNPPSADRPDILFTKCLRGMPGIDSWSIVIDACRA